MKTNKLIWIITALLVVTLAACDLPVITPPPAEVIPSATATTEQAIPLPTATIEVTEVVTEPIRLNNVSRLVLTQKAAVSNVQKINWAENSEWLAVITQNTDAGENQVYGFTALNAADLTTRSIFSTTGNRIAAIAPDGVTVAMIASDQSTFSLVKTGNGNEPAGGRITDYQIGNLTFSPDGRYLAVTKQESWEVVLYDMNNLEEVITLSGFETAAPVFNAGFDESTQWMVWFARGTIQLQEVETGMLGGRFQHEDFVSAYTLSPDGMILASSAAKTVNNAFVPAITLWDTTSSSEIKTLVMDEPVYTLKFSPDGKILAVAAGTDLQLWDPANGTLLHTLSGHTDMILQVAFSPDQKSIATSGLDNQLYLWQIPQ